MLYRIIKGECIGYLEDIGYTRCNILLKVSGKTKTVNCPLYGVTGLQNTGPDTVTGSCEISTRRLRAAQLYVEEFGQDELFEVML